MTDLRWSPSVDAAQGALVAVAGHGDGEAAITLLVQLRPALGRLVRHLAIGGLAHPDAVDDVRSTFFETVLRHRLDRRPTRIAANLVLDTRQRLARRQPSRSTSAPIGTGFDPSPPPQERSLALATDTLWAAAGALGGTEQSRRLSAEVGYRCWFLDQPRAVAAAATGLAPQAVAGRLHRLRRQVLAELDLPDGGTDRVDAAA